MSTPDQHSKTMRDAGFDGPALLVRKSHDAIKAGLIDNTAKAVARGGRPPPACHRAFL